VVTDETTASYDVNVQVCEATVRERKRFEITIEISIEIFLHQIYPRSLLIQFLGLNRISIIRVKDLKQLPMDIELANYLARDSH
jgi:hypothetical protein